MFRLPQFRFRSITHRLIFACVIAAIVIYGLSFWHMRQVTQEGVVSWMIQLAQSRVDTVAIEVDGLLQSVEQSADLVLMAEQAASDRLSLSSHGKLLQTLMAQQPLIQAVAVRFPRENKTELLGFRAEKSGAAQTLDDRSLTRLLDRCQNASNANSLTPQSFWTQPYPLDTLNESIGVTYCLSNSATNDRTKDQPNLLAIELTIDWIKPLVKSKLEVVDKFNRINVGQPLAIALPTKQWLVSPTSSIQALSWFSENDATLLASQTTGHSSSHTPTAQILDDSQGTLVFTTMPSTMWLFGIAFSKAELGIFLKRYLGLVIASMAKDMALMCVAIVLASQETTRPLRALIKSTEDIAQGNLNTVLPSIAKQDEVGRLGKAFRRMQDSLQTYIHELQVTTAAKQKMESELSIASQIQRSMLPRTDVADGCDRGYELSAIHQPARVVGGDLYDFFLLGEDHLCIIIGDVSGKGVPAALLMAQTVTLIRLMAKQTSTPVEILSAVNRELCLNNEECMFVTLFCGVLNLVNGNFSYASSGHDAPLLVRDHQAQFLTVKTGPPLGLEEDAVFPSCECSIQQNDLLLLYTDGLTEAMNPVGELFSEVRFLDIIANHPPSNPSRAIRTIQHFHRNFVEDAPQSDDLTLLAFQYQPSGTFLKEVTIVEWKITINSELTELEKVKQRLGEILQKKRLCVELIENAQLIVEEVLVNIIQYAYTDQCRQQIDLEVTIGVDGLSMTFEDRGKPFNPLTEVAAPDLSMDDSERSSGGLGVYLVRELADRIDYTYQDGKNILKTFQAIDNRRTA